LLAVLLLALATLAFYIWPIGPRWNIIGDEHPLGFDLQQSLLYTGIDKSKRSNWEYSLQGYDLISGERRVVQLIKMGKPERIQPLWRSILSADCSTIACYENENASLLNGKSAIEVFDIREQYRRLCRIEGGDLFSLALSDNGDTIAVQKRMDEVEVWNCRTGTIKHRLRLPPGALNDTTEGVGFAASGRCYCERMQFSSDGQYLAIASYFEVITVFDLRTGRVIGLCKYSSIPVFSSETGTIIALPGFNQLGDFHWYQLNEEKIQRLSISHRLKSDLHGLASAPGLLVKSSRNSLNSNSSTPSSLPKWIPSVLRSPLEAALGYGNQSYNVTSIETSSGRIRDDFIIQVNLPHRLNEVIDTKVSRDGLLLAVKEYEQLSLWNIPPRRSLACWLVCGGIACIALLVAWPRRVKQASGL